MAAQELNQADAMAIRATMETRVQYVVSYFCLYLLGLPDGDQEGESTLAQKGWARNVVVSPGRVASEVSYYLLNQTAFLENGSGIDASTLKGIIENAIRTHFFPDEPVEE